MGQWCSVEGPFALAERRGTAASGRVPPIRRPGRQPWPATAHVRDARQGHRHWIWGYRISSPRWSRPATTGRAVGPAIHPPIPSGSWRRCGASCARARHGAAWSPPRTRPAGSTLRRRLARWARTGLLAKGHALLVGMLRGHPDLILDACSVRAKRGGDLTGPNPTDRGKRGTKYHVAVDGDGVPVACAATAANANDTLVFERLFLAAFAVMARIRAVFADRGYDAKHHRDLCHRFGVEPHIHKRGQPHGSGLGRRRWPVERSNAWLLENRRLALRPTRLHRPVAAPGRLHIPGCRAPRPPIL